MESFALLPQSAWEEVQSQAFCTSPHWASHAPCFHRFGTLRLSLAWLLALLGLSAVPIFVTLRTLRRKRHLGSLIRSGFRGVTSAGGLFWVPDRPKFRNWLCSDSSADASIWWLSRGAERKTTKWERSDILTRSPLLRTTRMSR